MTEHIFLAFFFVPYYFLAVTAFFTHLACVFSKYVAKTWDLQMAHRLVYASMVLGMLGAVIILLTFSGIFYSFELPADYQELYPR